MIRYLKRGFARLSLDPSDGAAHYKAMAADPTVPLWANALELDILEACLLEPLDILFLLWEQHPHVGEEP